MSHVGANVNIEGSALIARNPRVAFHPLTEGQGGVLLHLDTAAYHGLNDVGFHIWELLGEELRFDQLVSLVKTRFADAPSDVDAEIGAYVQDLRARDLLRLTERNS
jgi:Coenzyme PQQ synthesis protein D (PqqD)